MKNLGALSALQFNALLTPIENHQQLQEAWDKPKAINYDNSRIWLLTLVVAKDAESYVWTAGLRLHNKAKSKLKRPSLWTLDQRQRGDYLLYKMLENVGDIETEDKTISTDYITIMRNLTQEEFSAMVRPALLNAAAQEKNGDKRRSNDKARPGPDGKAGFESGTGETEVEIREQED